MKKINKKGFTMIELVIVIAVVAVLAGVLIPTFTSLVHKANVSADTQLAKNLNTALATYEAINGELEDFSEVLAAAREAGYIISQLNPTAEGCYFVWDAGTNQIILVDSKDEYNVIYSIETPSEIGDKWHFVVSSKAKEAELASTLQGKGIHIQVALTTVDDLKAAIEAGGEIFIDESVILSADKYLLFGDDNEECVVNLGLSQLNADDSLTNKFPIEVNKATVTLNGGVVAGTGSGTDLDGDPFSSPIMANDGSNVTINDTQFNTPNCSLQFAGKAVLNNVTTSGYFYSRRNGDVELNNCIANNPNDVAIWVTNTISEQNNAYTGTATLTVNGGVYTSGHLDEGFGTVSVNAGTIIIKDGEFYSPDDDNMFGVLANGGIIFINGGTFNGETFVKNSDSFLKILQDMTAQGTVSMTDDGYKITK